MKRTYFLGCVCALLATVALPPSARAQKKRIVVEQFSGSSSDQLRQLVIDALGRDASFEVVPDKQVAAAEADLGLLQASDSYPAVAAQVKAAGFVAGKVQGKKKVTAEIVANDADGKPLGSKSWSGANAAAAVKAARGAIPTALAELLVKLKSAPAVPVAARPAEKPVKEEKVAAAPEATKKPAKKAAEKPKADEEVAEQADEEAAVVSSGALLGLSAYAGIRMNQRAFTYNENISGGQKDLTTPGPAVALGAEYFFLPYLGAALNFEYTILTALQWEDPTDQSVNTYPVVSLAWDVGLRGKYPLGPLQLGGGVSYGAHTFDISIGDLPDPTVAGVAYTMVRAGVDATYAVNDMISVTAGGGYRHLLGLGPLQVDYFPAAKGVGLDAFAGVAVALPWVAGLEARAMLNLRQYVFAMNSDDSDPDQDFDGNGRADYVAGGATDRYLGVFIGVGYRP